MKTAKPSVTTDFIKAGKEYPVKEVRGEGFTIDKKYLELSADSDLHCLYEGCTHLGGGNWVIEEK